MKVLITGSGGFIGSALKSELKDDPLFELFCVNGSSGKSIENKAGIEFIKADLSKPDFIQHLPATADVVVHLAQSRYYREFPDKAEDIFNVNVLSTQILLKWAMRAGVKKFIFASSGNVYKPQNKLLHESDPCEPIAFYGWSKYAAENIIRAYEKYFKIVILRVFGVYGPGQANMTIPNIIKRINEGEEITLAKGVGLIFTPLYIDDCVRVLKEIISDRVKLKETIYNLGGTEKVELGEVVKFITQQIGKAPKLRSTTDEPMYLMADATKLWNELQIEPLTDIKNGITKTIGYERA